MANPILVLRVGYMEQYQGPASITGCGSYVELNKVGGEVFNFKPTRGICYGYSWVSKHMFDTLEQVQDYATKWL